MSDHHAGHFTILSGYPPDVLAIRAEGHLTGEDYRTVLVPRIEKMIAAEGRVKLLYELGPGFEGLSAGAVWEDARLGIWHLADFARIAVVTDIGWIRAGLKLFVPLIPCPVQVFALEDRTEAAEWISAAIVDEA